MGQEISDIQFSPGEFAAFRERLRAETALLATWFRDGRFSAASGTGGFELEAWLVDGAARPLGINAAYLERLANPLVVPELAVFNVELNSTPLALRGDALSRMARELEATWGDCQRVAATFGARVAMVGILPTVGVEQLNLGHMSPMRRFSALNDQILALRAGRPLELAIQGRDRLELRHADVMLEAATTSFQIHLQVSGAEAARVYNVSKILAGPLVAISANSPYLFGRDLWDETRIPLFEQAVAVGGSELSNRVSFGVRYAESSILETFQANLDHYPILLPQVMDEPPERMAHVRLHNGTIWRWNRPLIGFDGDGRPHLRIEHRVVPAGPSIQDCIANAALYFGAARALLDQPEPAERQLAFDQARANFYAAARQGLGAELTWLQGQRAGAAQVVGDGVLPLAREGLARLGIAPDEIHAWLGIIEARLASGQTGAVWQRAFVARHGRDMGALTQAYLERQESGLPVHAWPL